MLGFKPAAYGQHRDHRKKKSRRQRCAEVRVCQFQVYGYPGDGIERDSPVELREVTLRASPEVLREIAKFLESAAGEIANGAEHLHLRDEWSGWPQGAPDIVAFRPE